MTRAIFIILLAFLAGCSSVASSTVALIVAEHSKVIERDTRRYKGFDRCLIDGMPSAFQLGQYLMSDEVYPVSYQYLLNPEHKKVDAEPRHHLAYAFYIIAERMGDGRAEASIAQMQQYFAEGEAKKIEEFVDFKYMQSHLSKCYSVPKRYWVRPTGRSLL